MGFDLAWLDLRENADRAARDGGLLRRAQAHLSGEADPLVVDLGAGTGATVAAFDGAPPARWRLIDNDPALLAAAARRHGSCVATIEADLTDLDALPLAGARLVTASALLDLASSSFVVALADRIAGLGAGIYAALSYDGRMAWRPADPEDARLVAAFNRHQLGDKGFGGPALGPDGGERLASAMRSRGYRVWTAPSPWRLGASEAALQREFLAGVAGAAAEAGAPDAEAWRQRRAGQVLAGVCVVGHVDILALPPG